jgi:hypothetical protein
VKKIGPILSILTFIVFSLGLEMQSKADESTPLTDEENWSYEKLIHLFTPGTNVAKIPLKTKLTSVITLRNCHNLTGCSDWKISQQSSPLLVYDQEIQYGYELKNPVHSSIRGKATYTVVVSQLEPILEFNDNGTLQLTINYGNYKPENEIPFARFRSVYNQSKSLFTQGNWDTYTFQKDFDVMKNCTKEGFMNKCEIGMDYNHGSFIADSIPFQKSQEVTLAGNKLNINFYEKSATSPNGTWTESQWTISGNLSSEQNQ